MRKKLICIDLDGVLNLYSGYYSKNTIAPIRDGASEFIKKLSENFKIEIFTVRENKLVWKWILDNNLESYICNVSDKKNPKATLFLDDRAIHFNGDYDNAYNSIINFLPHWKS